jgi:flagellar biosynthesis protein FlhB
MEDKLIPNREALRVLKRQGKVAWSRHATRALVAVAVLAYLMSFGAHYSGEVWSALQIMLAARVADGDSGWIVVRVVGMVIVTTSLIAVTVGILVSLVQTGLLVSVQLVRPIFRRSGFSGRTALSSVLPIVGLGLGGWLLFRYFRDILLVLRQPQHQALSSVVRVGVDLGKSVIVVALVFAILSLVASRLSFLWRHRMTKREMIGQVQK